MKANPPLESAESIDEVAARWVVRADRGLDDRERAALEAWLGGDSRRLGAYARQNAIWMHAERAGALGILDGLAAAETVVPEARPLLRRHVLLGGGLAAAGLAAAGLVPTILRRERRLATAMGEVRRVPLADGSAVTLDAASEIALRLDDRGRTARIEAGGALFEIARDPSRAFRIMAGAIAANAVDVVFAVHLISDGGVAVLVKKGVAIVTSAREGAVRRLVAGEGLTVAAGARLADSAARRIDGGTVERDLAWREGLLSFEGSTLADAVARFARWSRPAIVIDGADVARKTVSGLFAANDPKGFATAVAVSLDLQADVADDAIRLRARSPTKI